MGNYIIEDIIRFTGDAKSRAFWEKAVRILGEHIVAEEFGELKYHVHTRNIREPKKYLTSLLKKRIKTRETEKVKQPLPAAPEKLKTYFEENQLALFSSLALPHPAGQAEKREMDIPYGKETIPWATFMSSNFFTLSTNKAKSDTVQAKFRTMDGEVTVIPMLRGRIKPKGEELGIPTVEHGRILAAIENIWARQGSAYHSYADAPSVCYCYVSIRELAKLLGYTSFGGRDLVQLTNKVWNLKHMGYYLDLASLGFKNSMNRGFSLLHSVELAEGMKHGQMETILKVEFSTPLSAQLINRKVVSRPKEIVHIQSELWFLLRLYLEPRLMSLDDGAIYSQSLTGIIEDLALPAAGWHKRRDARRHVFQKALKSIKDKTTTDGREIIVTIEKGLTDWLLTARLEPVALPAKVG